MESNIAKAFVVIGSALVIVVLFAVLSDSDDSGTTETVKPEGASVASERIDGDESARSQPSQKGDRPESSKSQVPLLVIEGGQPKGGVRELEFVKSEQIRFAVKSDVDEEVHVHGYDVSEEVRAGKRTELAFEATLDGIYEVELEHSAVPIAELTVRP